MKTEKHIYDKAASGGCVTRLVRRLTSWAWEPRSSTKIDWNGFDPPSPPRYESGLPHLAKYVVIIDVCGVPTLDFGYWDGTTWRLRDYCGHNVMRWAEIYLPNAKHIRPEPTPQDHE